MRHMSLLLLVCTLAFGLPWPHPPMDTAHHIGNAWGNFQNYGSSYCHNGQDIMTTPLCPAVAIKAGYVKKIWLGGSPMYNGVTVGDSAGAAFCSGYMYYHIDNTTIVVQEGDTIQVGDTLGLIARWSVANFHHNHFSKNHNSGVIWTGYGTFYRNPLTELTPDDDSIVPNFLDAVSGQRFAICANNTSVYQSKDSVFGTVDLVCRLEDRINHRLWKVAVYKIEYSIRDTFGSTVVPRLLSVQFSDSIEAYDSVQARVVYKHDATCFTQCNYDSLARRYYYIFTNTDGDSSIDALDSLAGWNTAQVADGAYWVKVVASDEHGNTASDSMLVKVRNHPVSRHDVGVTRIASPPREVDSGSVVVPACTVYNYGTFAETYDVRMRVGSGYDTVVTVTSHAAGVKLAVTFPLWNVNWPLGEYAVTCSTRLGGDVFPLNDRRQDSVRVIPPVGVEEPAGVPVSFALAGVYPNPVTRQARVRYALPRAGWTELSLFDASGRAVLSLEAATRNAGLHTARIDAARLAAGVYWLKLRAGSQVAARKFVVQR